METSTKNAETDEEALIQLIAFRVGEEEFGVSIDAAREIIKLGQITPIPKSPPFIKGIVNVRGEIVTAIDMKLLFSLPSKKEVEAKHVIVTNQDDNLFGLIVDEVIEVCRVTKKDIKPAPSLLSIKNKKYVKGVISHEDRLLILLDLGLLFSRGELAQLSEQVAQKDSDGPQGKSTKKSKTRHQKNNPK